jgi:hypothetical protein
MTEAGKAFHPCVTEGETEARREKGAVVFDICSPVFNPPVPNIGDEHSNKDNELK